MKESSPTLPVSYHRLVNIFSEKCPSTSTTTGKYLVKHALVLNPTGVTYSASFENCKPRKFPDLQVVNNLSPNGTSRSSTAASGGGEGLPEYTSSALKCASKELAPTFQQADTEGFISVAAGHTRLETSLMSDDRKKDLYLTTFGCGNGPHFVFDVDYVAPDIELDAREAVRLKRPDLTESQSQSQNNLKIRKSGRGAVTIGNFFSRRWRSSGNREHDRSTLNISNVQVGSGSALFLGNFNLPSQADGRERADPEPEDSSTADEIIANEADGYRILSSSDTLHIVLTISDGSES